jgi:hypothetical protein
MTSQVFNTLCPHQACIAILDQARAHTQKILKGQFLADYSELRWHPDYQATKGAIAEALYAGDLEATKTACRTWCKLVISYTREHVTTEEHAA